MAQKKRIRRTRAQLAAAKKFSQVVETGDTAFALEGIAILLAEKAQSKDFATLSPREQSEILTQLKSVHYALSQLRRSEEKDGEQDQDTDKANTTVFNF